MYCTKNGHYVHCKIMKKVIPSEIEYFQKESTKNFVWIQYKPKVRTWRSKVVSITGVLRITSKAVRYRPARGARGAENLIANTFHSPANFKPISSVYCQSQRAEIPGCRPERNTSRDSFQTDHPSAPFRPPFHHLAIPVERPPFAASYQSSDTQATLLFLAAVPSSLPTLPLLPFSALRNQYNCNRKFTTVAARCCHEESRKGSRLAPLILGELMSVQGTMVLAAGLYRSCLLRTKTVEGSFLE